MLLLDRMQLFWTVRFGPSWTHRAHYTLASNRRRTIDKFERALTTIRELAVFHDTPVANVPELNTRLFVLIGCFLFSGHRSVRVSLVVGVVLGGRRRSPDRLAQAVVGLVAPDPNLFAMEQFTYGAAIGGVRRRHDHRVAERGTAQDAQAASPRSTTDCPSSADAVQGRARRAGSIVKLGASMIMQPDTCTP